MISFRYHVVSLVAVLLALAAGVVLGSGPLQREDTDEGGTSDAAALREAEQRVEALEESVTFDDAFATAISPTLVSGSFKDRAFTLVSLPGADPVAAARIGDAVIQGGGAVTAQVEVGDKLLDVDSRQLITELATQIQDTAQDAVEVPAEAGGYERLGLLLGHALGTTRDQGERVDAAGDSILAALATADLVTSRGTLDRRGSVVILLAGEPVGSDDDRQGAGSIVASLAVAFDGSTDGVLVAGPLAAGQTGGIVEAVRTDPTSATQVSTVDVTDRAAGAVVTVLALVGEKDGTTGHYGSSRAPGGPIPGSR